MLRFHRDRTFNEHSDLRPSTTVECAIKVTTDEEGKEDFQINIGKANPKVASRTTGKAKSPAAGSQEQWAGATVSSDK